MDDKYSLDFGDRNYVDVDIPRAPGISRGVVPIGFWDGATKMSLLASAFCISPTLKSGDVVFATAKHVFADVIEGLAVKPFIAVPRSSNNLKSLVMVPIREVCCAEQYADVALFVVNPMRDAPEVESKPAVFKVTFGPPRVGEHCLALGFPQNREATDYRLTASDGVIEEVHERRRDGAFITYPSFRVGASYTPAMSGGPILGTDGRVIGVVSTGCDIGNPQDAFSYGATIGSILELSLDLYTDSGEMRECPVPYLAHLGFIGDRADPVVTLDRMQDGLTLTWRPPIESNEGDGLQQDGSPAETEFPPRLGEETQALAAWRSRPSQASHRLGCTSICLGGSHPLQLALRRALAGVRYRGLLVPDPVKSVYRPGHVLEFS